jgi:hypothetical protein
VVFLQEDEELQGDVGGTEGGVREGGRVGGLAGVYVGLEEGLLGRAGAGSGRRWAGDSGRDCCFQWFVSAGCGMSVMLIGNRSIACERGEKNAFGRMCIWGLYEGLDYIRCS